MSDNVTATGAGSLPRRITVEVYADLVCPWCWIGERRLFSAIEALRAVRADAEFDLIWRPFQLDPGMPEVSMPWPQFVERKFGGDSMAQPMFAQVAAAGATDGLDFRFETMAHAPNTARAHGLVVHVQQHGGNPWPLAEQLFAAHFTQGRDIGSVDTLLDIAVAAGITSTTSPEVVREVLETQRYAVDVQQSQREAARLGIRGVPFVVLDSRYGVSGAQPRAVFEQALQRALDDQ